MRKQAYILVLFLGVLLSGFFAETWVINQYVFNNQNFTEEFCENKDKPELECNGSCAVKKITHKDPVDDSPLQTEQEEVKKYSLTFFIEIDEEQVHAGVGIPDFFRLNTNLVEGVTRSVDHPPVYA